MKNRKRFIALELAVCAALIFSTAAFSAKTTAEACDDIKENVLRLHIIANSDSEDDQRVKLLVRDALLSAGSELFDGETDIEKVTEKADDDIAFLEQTAQRVLEENGFSYEARAEIGKSRFPTREYENVTLPAGEYTAVRVILGEGKGHNWWCVMFPPLCLSAAEDKTQLSDVLGEDALSLVEDGRKYKVKFKLIEWYESIKETLEDKKLQKEILQSHKTS